MPISIELVEQEEQEKAVSVLHSIQDNNSLCLKEYKELPKLDSKRLVPLNQLIL